MSVGARFFIGLLLAAVVQVFVLRCYAANESGWFLNQDSPLHGGAILHVSATGVKIEYKHGYTFVMSAPEWTPVAYTDSSKIYCKSSIRDYLVKMTHSLMVSGLQDIDSENWSRPQPCLLDGRPTVKYTYRAKRPETRVQAAECWFSTEIPVSRALAEISTGLNRTPRDPHLLIRYILHKSVGDHGIVVIETAQMKKCIIPPNCYSYPKNYRFVSNPVQVVMGNVGQDIMDEIIQSPIHH
jgi:hypothetical protein